MRKWIEDVLAGLAFLGFLGFIMVGLWFGFRFYLEDTIIKMSQMIQAAIESLLPQSSFPSFYQPLTLFDKILIGFILLGIYYLVFWRHEDERIEVGQ
jgi:uncharacterized membrane protein (DUF373 family)